METQATDTVEQIVRASGLRILASEEPVPENVHMAQIMDFSGDQKVIWDPSKPDEVAAAKATWDTLKQKGYWGYSVEGKKGEKGELLKEFDPEAGRMILAPRLVGG